MTCLRCKGTGYFRIEVPITDPRFGRAIPCECKQAEVAQALKAASRIGETQESWTLDNFPGDDKVREHARRAYGAKQGLWVFWSAEFGTGKTGLLIAIVNAFQADGVPALYKSVPRMLDELRAAYKDGDYYGLMDSLIEVPVLALDEFYRWHDNSAGSDAHGSHSWAAEKMFTLVDERYLRADKRMTLVATNRDPGAGHDPVSSRFSDARVSHVIEVSGPDMRRNANPNLVAFETEVLG